MEYYIDGLPCESTARTPIGDYPYGSYPYDDCYPYRYYPYEDYYPSVRKFYTDTNNWIQTFFLLVPTNTEYENEDLPVIEIQLKNSYYAMVLKNVSKVEFGDRFLKVIHKINSNKNVMKIPIDNIVAVNEVKENGKSKSTE